MMEDTLGNKVCRVVMRMLYIVSICFHMESEVSVGCTIFSYFLSCICKLPLDCVYCSLLNHLNAFQTEVQNEFIGCIKILAYHIEKWETAKISIPLLMECV